MTHTAAAPAPRLPYEPSLDGLRGLAVLGIAGYNAGIPVLAGCFLGVDVFFVLSGYLITRLLLLEWERERRIDLKHFWERRARRLLPAMLLTLSAISAYAFWAAAPAELARIRGDALSTLLYFNNWWQIAEGHSYFDLFAGLSPLHHAWSLSLEEQWFILWPLLSFFVLARTHSPAVLGWLSVGMAFLSACLMAWLFVPNEDPSRVYYGTDTRAHEILVGAALACLIHTGRLPLARYPGLWAAVGTASLLGLGTLWFFASDTAAWVYRGGMVLVSLLTAAIITGSQQQGLNPLRTFLCIAPLRWIGLISYGIYLWHLPVYLIVGREETGLSGFSLLALRLAITMAAATVSYFVLERPIRRGVLNRRRALVAAITASASVGMLAIASTAGPQQSIEQNPDIVTALQALDPSLGDRRPLHVMLVGGSIAWTLGNGFTPSVESAAAVEVTNRAMPGCGLGHGQRRVDGRVARGNNGRACGEWPIHWARYLERDRPDIVVVFVGTWDIHDREADGQWLEFGTEAFDAYLRGLLANADEVLGASGARVVYLTNPYYNRIHPTSATNPTMNERWRIDRFNRVLAEHVEASHHANVSLVDFGARLCDDEACKAIYGTTPLRDDGAHFSHEGAVVAATWLATTLHQLQGAEIDSQGGSHGTAE